jgi:predicted CoA-binding protein
MRPEIQNFINSKQIAVIGVAPSGKKFGNAAYKELKKRGYTVYPVHPTAETIQGDKAFDNLQSLPDDVESVFIAIKPDKTDKVVDDAIAKGIKRIWFQQGADFVQPAAKAEAAGIKTVTGKCILMYAEPVGGFHAFHRFLWKLLGKL